MGVAALNPSDGTTLQAVGWVEHSDAHQTRRGPVNLKLLWLLKL